MTWVSTVAYNVGASHKQPDTIRIAFFWWWQNMNCLPTGGSTMGDNEIQIHVGTFFIKNKPLNDIWSFISYLMRYPILSSVECLNVKYNKQDILSHLKLVTPSQPISLRFNLVQRSLKYYVTAYLTWNSIICLWISSWKWTCIDHLCHHVSIRGCCKHVILLYKGQTYWKHDSCWSMPCNLICSCKRHHTGGNTSPVGGAWNARYHGSCCVLIMAEQLVMNSSDLDAQACPLLMICVLCRYPYHQMQYADWDCW